MIKLTEIGKTCPKCKTFFLGNECPRCGWSVLPVKPKTLIRKKQNNKGVFR